MTNRIDLIKGIHPGKFIEWDLKRKSLTQRYLAQETGIPYQTINAIVSGRRNLTTEQAIKIERLLNYEEGFLAILQTYFDIKQYKEKELINLCKEVPNIRKSLFWDANFDKINWLKHKNVVIQRVLERGNTVEIEEIKRYYNLSTEELKKYKVSITQRRFTKEDLIARAEASLSDVKNGNVTSQKDLEIKKLPNYNISVETS